MGTTPIPYPTRPKTWFERHLVLVICGGGGFVVLFIVAGVFGIFYTLAHSTPAAMALDKAQHSPVVLERLGTPIRRGSFVSGNINTTGSGGHADLSFPISGPKGAGTVYVVANRENGTWSLETLAASFSGSDDRVVLLGK